MTSVIRRSLLAAMVLSLTVGVAHRADAAIVQVTSRAALGGTDFVDWGTLGPVNTSVPNPTTVTSNGGVVLDVSQVLGPFQRRDEGNGWNGIFAKGDHLLWTNGDSGSAGPLTIAFPTGISAVGAQVQNDVLNGPFTAEIDLFDSSHNLLAAFTLGGNNTGAEDNSAPFLGARSDLPNIAFITFSIPVGARATNFAINQLDFQVGSHALDVPEPSSLANIGLAGLAVLACSTWRPKRPS